MVKGRFIFNEDLIPEEAAQAGQPLRLVTVSCLQVANAVRHLLNARLHAALSGWQAQLQRSAEQRHAAEAALARLLHASMAAAFAAWREDVTERGSLRRRLRAFLSRLQQQVGLLSLS